MTVDRRRNIPSQADAWFADHGCLFPETLQRWDYHNDPLIENEGPSPRHEAWDYEDPYSTVFYP